MTEYCSKCGEALKEDAIFCANCGEKVPNRRKGLSRKHLILLLIVIVVIVLAIVASSFFIFNQNQTVRVEDVHFELPSDYVKEPSRTDVNYDGNVKSSAMGWSNEENYIEIGVTNTPGSGINSEEVASTLGGSPTKMFGYSGYLLDYDNEGYAFVFGLRDEVCMIYVDHYDAFDDVKVIGQDE